MRGICLAIGLAVTSLAVAPRSATAACSTTATEHCLQGKRFRVAVDWHDFGTGGGDAHTVAGPTADSGLFWFYGPDNWEILVKLLDGCRQNDHFWVFAAAATTLDYTITVTDTLTGAVRTYSNPLGTSSPAITDTEAFETCSGSAVPTPTPTPKPHPTPTPRRSPTPTPTAVPMARCPADGPPIDLTTDCITLTYFYFKGTVTAALASNGDTAAVCYKAPTTNLLCLRGHVNSPSEATLSEGNVNLGPWQPTDSGSALSIADRIMDVTLYLDGQVYDLTGFRWIDTQGVPPESLATLVPSEDLETTESLEGDGLTAALRRLIYASWE